MQTQGEMIDKIYEVIASKELSFGCIVEERKKPYIDLNRRRIGATAPWETYEGGDDDDGDEKRTGNIDILCPYFTGGGSMMRKACSTDIVKIKGHPVMIGDCLDWIEKNARNGGFGNADGFMQYNSERLVLKRVNYRKPIEDNPEAITFIYNLLPNDK